MKKVGRPKKKDSEKCIAEGASFSPEHYSMIKSLMKQDKGFSQVLRDIIEEWKELKAKVELN